MIRLPVTNDKFQPGIGTLTDSAPRFELIEFDTVFDRTWTSDVHFACYSIIEPGERKPTDEPFPRIRKTAVSSIREAGGDVVLTALTLDWDLSGQPDLPPDSPVDDEGKPVWTTEMLEAFLAALGPLDAALAERRIARPLVYTTTHGARFVHPLAKAVPCEDGEDLLRGMHKVYGDLDFKVDPLDDWTRLFRAPKVRRGRSNTGEARWFYLRWGEGLTNPAAIDPISKQAAWRDRYVDVQSIDRAKPTPQDAHARLWVVDSKGRQKQAAMRQRAARILRGTDCYGPIFDMAPIADEGARDQTLVRLVGQATTFLLGPLAQDATFSAEDIYALFLGPVQELEPDSGTPDWTDSLWSKVKSCYAREQAKLRAQEEDRQRREEVAERTSESLLSVVGQTCDLPELHSADPVEAQTALRRLMLIREPSGRFRAMKPDGGYTNVAVPQGSLHFLIGRAAGIDDIVPLWGEDLKGSPKVVSEVELARQATDVQRIVGASGIARSHLSGRAWDELVLHLALYRRSPRLEPEYSSDVDEWLELLTPDPRSLRRWLAYALDFEGGPICALSLAGAPGAGKGLLAQGLVETLDNPIRADKTALVGRFNASLSRTPFLIVDEGLPHGVHDIADSFRSMVSGDPITCEEKFQTPIEVRNPMRVLFTANNDEVIRQLASHRINDSQDQLALAQRISHMPVLEAAALHLRAKGGLGYTRGWVQGSDGTPSSYILARHLLYLHSVRSDFGPPDARLLVEGAADCEVVQSLRSASRVSQAICRAILTAVEQGLVPSVRDGVSIEGARLRVTTRAIEEQHRQLNESNVQLNVNLISRAMRNLCSAGYVGSIKQRQKTLGGSSQQQRWWDVDVDMLHSFAEEAGYPREIIRRLRHAQDEGLDAISPHPLSERDQ